MMSAPAPTNSGCLGGVAISAAEVVAKTLAISGAATPRFMPSAEDNRSGEILRLPRLISDIRGGALI
jgi:hypothetical protein